MLSWSQKALSAISAIKEAVLDSKHDEQKNMPAHDARNERNKGLKKILAASGLIFGFFIFSLVLFSFKSGFWGVIWNFGVGCMLFTAYILCGGFAGFLFGIPRVAQSAEGDSRGLYTNTNLEQISDWITKIIVGIGLTEINNIDDKLSVLAKFSAKSFDDGISSSAAESVSISIIISGFILGFIFTYINTRTFIHGIFSDTDDERLKKDLEMSRSIELKSSPPTPSKEKAAALERVAALDPLKASSAEDLLAIGKAQFFSGKRDEADSTFELATASARQQKNAGLTIEASLEYIFSSLYRTSTHGYLNAIREGERLARESNLSPGQKARLHTYIAAAQGQRHARAVADQDETQITDARDRAVDAVKIVRKHDEQGAWIATLRGMLNPKAADNDLSTLAADTELLALLEPEIKG